MGMITVSSNDKPIEASNLEAHVALCAQRHKSLEGKVNEIIENHKMYKRIFVTAAITVVTGLLSAVGSLLFHLSGKLL